MARRSDRDRFIRGYAIVLICIGWTLVGTTALGAVVLDLASGAVTFVKPFVGIGFPEALSRVLATVVRLTIGTVLALALGTPFIVAGHLIHLGVDQRRLLRNQARILRRIRRGLAPSPAHRNAAHERTRLANRLAPR